MTITTKGLLKALEEEKRECEVCVDEHDRHFFNCLKRHDYNQAAVYEREMREKTDQIRRLNIAINVIKERVT